MNKHISQFNWSNKTNTKLINLGINTIEDFNDISIEALKEMGIPKTVVKQIENICKVHNIKTKETSGLKAYWFEYRFRHVSDKDNIHGYPRMALYAARNKEHAKELLLHDYDGKSYELVGDYSIRETRINIGDRIV